MDGEFITIQNWLPAARASELADLIEHSENWIASIANRMHPHSFVNLATIPPWRFMQEYPGALCGIPADSEPAIACFMQNWRALDPELHKEIEAALVAMLGADLVLGDDLHASMFLPGCYLTRHRDSGNGRRYAFTLNLTRNWCPEMGGCLTILANDEWSMAPPEFNTLALIDVRAHTSHYVSQVASWATRKRIAISGWLSK